jgi:hypothetical protein
LKPTAITKEFFKASSQDEAFSFKPFQLILVFNAVRADGNIIDNLLIVSTNANCKKKVYEGYLSGKAFD